MNHLGFLEGCVQLGGIWVVEIDDSLKKMLITASIYEPLVNRRSPLAVLANPTAWTN
jgi:hypothetical protein